LAQTFGLLESCTSIKSPKGMFSTDKASCRSGSGEVEMEFDLAIAAACRGMDGLPFSGMDELPSSGMDELPSLGMDEIPSIGMDEPPSSGGGSTSARSSDGRQADHDLTHDMIRKAQFEAAAKHGQHVKKEQKHLLSASQLCGAWTDSLGNFVSVYPTDAYHTSLSVTLTRVGRGDIHLPLHPVGTGCGWHCGDGMMISGSETEVWWAFPNGSVSAWTRTPTAAAWGKKSSAALLALPNRHGQRSGQGAKRTAAVTPWIPLWMPACA